MAVENIPISQLPEASTASDSDVLAIDNGTTTYKITVENFNATGTASAQAAAEAAAASATAASESATAALGYKNTVESALNDASTIVSNAQTYANSAESSKNDASGYASAASTSASQAATSASQAASYATGVQEYATEAKSWAQGGTGTRVDEETTNCAYYANAAHTSEANASTSETNAATSESNAATSETNASASASSASVDALKAEGYAVGTQNGTAAESGEPYYQDNAKYYKEQAADSATYADGAATIADTKAGQALLSASEAKESEEDSEAWAWGKIDGVDVPSTHPAYHNNAKYWADAASGGASGGVTSFNGRSGIVSPASGDYDGYMISYSGDVSASNVTDAIDAVMSEASDLQTEINNLATVASTGLYSDLSNTPTLGTAAAQDATGSISQGSSDLVTSGAVYDGLSYKADAADLGTAAGKDYTANISSGSSDLITSGAVYTGLGDKLPTYSADSTAWDSAPTANSTKPVTSGGLKTAIDAKSHVEVDVSGTASSSTTRDFTISVDGGFEYPISRYMEQVQTVSTSTDTTYTFTNAAITANSVIDVYADVFGINPSNEVVTVLNNIGTCTVTIPKQSSAFSLGIRIYIK